MYDRRVESWLADHHEMWVEADDTVRPAEPHIESEEDTMTVDAIGTNSPTVTGGIGGALDLIAAQTNYPAPKRNEPSTGKRGGSTISR